MKIAIYLLLFVFVILVYTWVFYTIYPVLEGKEISRVQALLFVVETVTTVGYGDLLPFNNDLTAVAAMVMMLTGIVFIFMALPLLLVPYLATLLHPTPSLKTPVRLSHHIVIIGGGELTRSLMESLSISDLEIVMVNNDEVATQALVKRYRHRAFVIWGSYSDAKTWANAWVKDASYVIVCEEERATANIILGLRQMTDAKIVAVVDKLSFDRYLRYAGAEYVLSPKFVTGRILARHAALLPLIIPHNDALGELRATTTHPRQPSHPSGSGVIILQVPVLPGSHVVGKRLADLDLYERFGVVALILVRGGCFTFLPGVDEVLDSSSTIFLLGTADRLPQIMEEFLARSGDRPEIVIAGYGDVGTAAYHELKGFGLDPIVIDRTDHQIPEVKGNAEDEDTLKLAHIDDAAVCIVALNDDDINIFTTLMARNLNPSLRILARANEPASVEKLYHAGADYVALLPTIGGQVVAGVILSGVVKVLLDLPNGSKIIQRWVQRKGAITVAEIERRSGTTVLALEVQGRSIISPGPNEHIDMHDTVLAIGNIQNLRRLIHLLG